MKTNEEYAKLVRENAELLELLKELCEISMPVFLREENIVARAEALVAGKGGKGK